MKLKEFGIIIRTIGIICLFLFMINNVVPIPLSIVIMISIGYLCSAASCSAKLLHPSVKHHKLVNYFIAFLGFIFIMKNL